MYICFLELLSSSERHCLKDLGGKKRIILKRILKKQNGRHGFDSFGSAE